MMENTNDTVEVKPTLIYCYDAYCGWCYGFSSVIRKLYETYRDRMDFDVLSGGMIPRESAQPIGRIASYIQGAYKQVEALSGIRFGEDFLWHIFHPEQSDWFPHSETPAIALAVFRDYFPEKVVPFAADLQYALHMEGRDLTDKEAYRHLVEGYGIPVDEFYERLASEEYKDKAYYEFSLVKQLQVTGFPAVLLQTGDRQFYLLASGFTDYETLRERVDRVLEEVLQLPKE